MQDNTNIRNFCQQIWSTGQQGCFRLFKGDGSPGINVNGTFEQFERYLTLMNEAGYSIFLLPNTGGHSDIDITRYNAVFIDIDAGGLPKEWHQPPNYIFTRGDNKVHAYWLLPQPNDYDETKFRTVQKQLAQHYNSDPVIINPSRVMRLPYFDHHKEGITSPGYQEKYQQVATVSSDPSIGLPELTQAVVTYDGIQGDDIICENWITVETAKGYLQRREGGVQGEYGDEHMRATFAYLHDLGLTQELSVKLVKKHLNSRCDPPWSDTDLTEKCRNGYRYTKSHQGCKAFIFGQQPRPEGMLSEPPGVVIPDVIDDGNYKKKFNIPISDSYVSDDDNAVSFLNVYYGGGKYLHALGQLIYRWNGKYWKIISKEILDSQYHSSMRTVTDNTAKKTSQVMQQIMRVAHMNGTFIKEPPPSHIVCKNGVVDMDTGKLLKHNHKYFYIACNKVKYNPKATAPIMDGLIESYAKDKPGWERQLNQMMGYAMGGGYNDAEKVMVMEGPTRSGKTLIAQTVLAIIGKTDTLSTSIGKFGDDKVIHKMFDAKLVYDDDAQTPGGQDMKEVAGLFKKITSGTDFSVPQLYTQELKIGILNPKILICCNGVPVISDHSGATLARMLVLPFTESFVGREDNTLKRNIKKKELAGIFNRFIKGYQDYKDNGFVVCESSLQVHAEEVENVQPLMQFFNNLNHCTMDPDHKVKSSTVFAHVRQWCEGMGLFLKMSSGQFAKNVKATLASKNIQYKHSVRFSDGTVTTGFVGLSLTNDIASDGNNVVKFQRPPQ